MADISEIVPGRLYLGDARAAADRAALGERGVSHVVNCTGSDGSEGGVPDHHADAGLAYFRLPLLDRPTCPLLPLLPPALRWAAAAIDDGGCVFAHCHAGSSRSGAFVIAYLMQNRRQSYAEAFATARGCRSVVKPNAGFKAALRAFQLELGLPPPEPLSPAELHSDAQEFADAEMAARIARTGEPLWDGYDAYMGKFESALSRGVTDWESVAAGGGIPEGIPEPARLAEDGDAELAELRHTTSFRLPDETIDAYEARLGQMAAAAGHGVPDRPAGGRPTDSAELLAALPAPPGVDDAYVVQEMEDSGHDQLAQRLEWLKALDKEDGAPLEHSGPSPARWAEQDLERRLERLKQLQQAEHAHAGATELEPEPE